ncbi:MAG: D-alanine--poly(phosphoribitol) ligase, subunit 1 [Candidatus Parcubacteria bacterium]|jgi:amino acid adenylation domain-containing protein
MQSIITGPENKNIFEKNQTVFESIISGINCENISKTAIICKDKSYTYEQFLVRVKEIYTEIQSKGVKRGDSVCFLLDRDLDLLCTIFAIALTGATYIPISPLYPASMVEFILNDSVSNYFITQNKYSSLLTKISTSSSVIFIEKNSSVTDNLPAVAFTFPKIASLDDVAYVLYTSGTTGVPKGVAIKHRSLLNDIHFMTHMQAKEHVFDITLFSTNICFDQSVEEIFPALSLYKTIIIANDFYDNFWIGHLPTLVVATPTVFRTGITYMKLPQSTKTLVLGGEKLVEADIENVFKHTNIDTIYNSYGPTECTDQCCVKTYTRDGIDRTVSVGTPILNTSIYILDPEFQPVPVGEIGEIYVAGEGVSAGYVNRPELNSKMFVPDIIQSNDVELKMYKSGDLGKINDKGELVCIDRIDKQIKLNGQRIEGGAIINTMLKVPGISAATLNVHVDDTGTGRLFGYVMPETADTEKIRQVLTTTYPSNHVPIKIFALKEFPETLNGKLDTNRLPITSIEKTRSDIVAPANDTEVRLVHLFKSILKIDGPISITDNFYELGGHSILAAQLLSQINNTFKSSMSMLDFLTDPRPIYLSSLLSNDSQLNSDDVKKAALSSIMTDPSTFLEGGKKVLVIGSGVAGIRVATFLKQLGTDFSIVEKNSRVGGVWLNTSKDSKLQVTSDTYQLDDQHPFQSLYPNRDEVIEYLEKYTQEQGFLNRIQFNTEVVDIHYTSDKKFNAVLKKNGVENVTEFDSVIICTGRLQVPYIPKWANNCYMTNRACHSSAIDKQDLQGKDIVVVGAGSYAIESFILAHKRGAKSVTLLARKTYWILPSFAESALNSYINPDTVDFKEDYSAGTSLLRSQLSNYYKINGLEKLIPRPEYSGLGVETSTSDDFFAFARLSNSHFVIDEVDHIVDQKIFLKNSVQELNYDYLICATGYHVPEYSFLKTICGLKPFLYKGYMSLNDPRITFVGLTDDIISFVKPLKFNIEAAYNCIRSISQRPSIEKIRQWVVDTPYDLLVKYKSYLDWIKQDEK